VGNQKEGAAAFAGCLLNRDRTFHTLNSGRDRQVTRFVSDLDALSGAVDASVAHFKLPSQDETYRHYTLYRP